MTALALVPPKPVNRNRRSVPALSDARMGGNTTAQATATRQTGVVPRHLKLPLVRLPVDYGMPTYCVYVIADPSEVGVVKYVGMTTNVERRMKEHYRRKSPLGEWLRALRAAGLEPDVQTYHHTTDKREAMEREYKMIRLLRDPCGCEFNAPTCAPSWLVKEWVQRLPTAAERMEAMGMRFPV
jgi:predicted GIY-YIG superfamily endonuclease